MDKTQLNNAVLGVLDHGRRIKEACDSGVYRIPPTSKGKQTLKGNNWKKGTRVRSLGTGSIIAGIEGTVTDRYKQNGFWYYKVHWDPNRGSVVERQQDIEKA